MLYKLLLVFFTLPFIVNGQSFPDKLLKVNDWQSKSDKSYYDEQNLYDYINGASDFYLSYSFKDLWVVDYTSSDNEVLTLEIYRHKNPYCAFGIYVEERPLDANKIPIGTESHLSDGAYYILTGSYYVKIFPREKTNDAAKMEAFAKMIVSLLSNTTQFPIELSYFPKEGSISETERYTAENYLGQEGFNGVFAKSYRIGNQAFKLFILKQDSLSADKIVANYFKNTNYSFKQLSGFNIVKDKYNGPVMIYYSKGLVIGILGHPKPNKVQNLISEAIKLSKL